MAIEIDSYAIVEEIFNEVPCTCCHRQVPGKIIRWPRKDEKIVLHMPCSNCERWLGHLEQDNREALKGMCLECLEEEKN